MKRLLAFCIALMCVGFMASTLFAAPAPYTPSTNPQMNSANFALNWSAAGEISGGASTSVSHNMNATIGQMAANTSSISANYGLCTGFECVLNTLWLYLPLIRR